MRQTRKSSLFLMELIIAILFFSLSAAVCVRLFAASYKTSQQSSYRDIAMLQAQTMAELFQNAQGDITPVLAFAGAKAVEGSDSAYVGSITQDGVTYQVNLQWAAQPQPTTQPETLSAGQSASLSIAITPPQQTEPIITLQTKVYLPLQAKGAV